MLILWKREKWNFKIGAYVSTSASFRQVCRLSNAGRTVDCRKSKNTLCKFTASYTLEVAGNSDVCSLMSSSLPLHALQLRAPAEKVTER